MSSQYYLHINGEKIYVDEITYYEYMRPVWREKKRRLIRRDKERSIDYFENGADGYPSQEISVEDVFNNQLLIEQLHLGLQKLTFDEKALIFAVYYERKSLRQYADEVGTNHTKIIRQHKALLKKLKTILEYFEE